MAVTPTDYSRCRLTRNVRVSMFDRSEYRSLYKGAVHIASYHWSRGLAGANFVSLTHVHRGNAIHHHSNACCQLCVETRRIRTTEKRLSFRCTRSSTTVESRRKIYLTTKIELPRSHLCTVTPVDKIERHLLSIGSHWRIVDDGIALTYPRSTCESSIFRYGIGRTANEKRRTPRAFGSTFGARLTAGTISNWAKHDVRVLRIRARSANQSALGCRFDDLRSSRNCRVLRRKWSWPRKSWPLADD